MTVASLVELVGWMDAMGMGGDAGVMRAAVAVQFRRANRLELSSPLLDEVMAAVDMAYQRERRTLTRDGLPVRAYLDFCVGRPAAYSLRKWVRDALIVGLAMRCIRRPAEVAAFRLGDLRFVQPASAGWRLPVEAPEWVPHMWLRVEVRSQKNDRRMRGHTVLVDPTGAESCVVVRLLWYLEVYGLKLADRDSGDPRERERALEPLLRDCRVARVNEGMSAGGINSVFKQLAERSPGTCAGLRITGHSGRIGGVGMFAAAGLSLAVIMSVGGWLSRSVITYVQAVAAASAGVSSTVGLGFSVGPTPAAAAAGAASGGERCCG